MIGNKQILKILNDNILSLAVGYIAANIPKILTVTNVINVMLVQFIYHRASYDLAASHGEYTPTDEE